MWRWFPHTWYGGKALPENTAIYEADFGGEEDVESGEYENTYKPLSGREMAILAIFLVVEGIQTFKKQKALKKA